MLLKTDVLRGEIVTSWWGDLVSATLSQGTEVKPATLGPTIVITLTQHPDMGTRHVHDIAA